ncbi:SiaB family protein kinase [Endothiovibrio diazotrophicus]
MLAEEMYDFRNRLREQGVVFCYSGYFTEEILAGVGGAIRRKLELEAADRNTVKGLFSIFVEQVQNIIRYSAEREPPPGAAGESLRYGVLTVGREGDRHFVSCANLIRRADVERLDRSLHRIRGLDHDALKALYKETLRGAVPEGSVGAGVGFIDIARRARRGFTHDFFTVDDETAYFCLKAYV